MSTMSETCQRQLWLLKFKLKTVTINKSENIGRGEQPEERHHLHLLYGYRLLIKNAVE